MNYKLTTNHFFLYFQIIQNTNLRISNINDEYDYFCCFVCLPPQKKTIPNLVSLIMWKKKKFKYFFICPVAIFYDYFFLSCFVLFWPKFLPGIFCFSLKVYDCSTCTIEFDNIFFSTNSIYFFFFFIPQSTILMNSTTRIKRQRKAGKKIKWNLANKQTNKERAENEKKSES